MGRTVSYSLAIVATFLLLSSAAADDASAACRSRKGPIAISPFCKSATNQCRCSSMAGGATTWPEAMTNTINAAIKQINARRSTAVEVTARLPGNLGAASLKGIDTSCKSSFESVVSQLEDAIGYVQDDPRNDLATQFKGLWLADCLDTLELNEVSSPEVKDFDQYLIDVTNNLVSILKSNPKYAE